MPPLRNIVSAALIACFASAPAIAQAADWTPDQPVKIVVPIIGSTNDLLARLVAPHLSEALGQPVIVENKAGAGGNIGADYVAKSKPDGLTLLVGYNGPIAVNKTLFSNLPYDPETDFAPITLAVTAPQYLAVPAQNAPTDLQAFIKKAKDNPGKLSYASVAVGSASHLTMEMFKRAAGMDLVHVPYRGASPALVDLVSGTVDAAFMVPGNVQEFVKDGRLRILASTGKERTKSMPDIPTLAESGYPGFLAISWVGFLAPAKTPPEIIARYNKEMVRILQLPEIKQQLEDIEFDVVATSPQEFSEWIHEEVERWGTAIKQTGAKVN